MEAGRWAVLFLIDPPHNGIEFALKEFSSGGIFLLPGLLTEQGDAKMPHTESFRHSDYEILPPKFMESEPAAPILTNRPESFNPRRRSGKLFSRL